MSTYSAVYAPEPGPAIFGQLSDLDLPEGDVTVDVAWSSLNYKDGLAVTGKGRIMGSFPMVAGIDLAGPTGTVGVSALTSAELRLLPYLQTHLTYAEIGQRLYVSTNTVKTQLRTLYRKLDVSTRHEAIERARQVGLLVR